MLSGLQNISKVIRSVVLKLSIAALRTTDKRPNFNPGNLEEKRLQGHWKGVGGGRSIFDTIHPIDKIIGTYVNNFLLYFQFQSKTIATRVI